MGDLKNDTATILKYKDDANWMVYANSVFLTNCQSCHGPDGSGVVGPNLTDDYYKNVKRHRHRRGDQERGRGRQHARLEDPPASQ